MSLQSWVASVVVRVPIGLLPSKGVTEFPPLLPPTPDPPLFELPPEPLAPPLLELPPPPPVAPAPPLCRPSHGCLRSRCPPKGWMSSSRTSPSTATWPGTRPQTGNPSSIVASTFSLLFESATSHLPVTMPVATLMGQPRSLLPSPRAWFPCSTSVNPEVKRADLFSRFPFIGHLGLRADPGYSCQAC